MIEVVWKIHQSIECTIRNLNVRGIWCIQSHTDIRSYSDNYITAAHYHGWNFGTVINLCGTVINLAIQNGSIAALDGHQYHLKLGPNGDSKTYFIFIIFVGISFGRNGSVVVLGDLNARVGNEVIEGIVRQHVVPGRNESGDRLLEMCVEQELVVGYSWFNKKHVVKNP